MLSRYAEPWKRGSAAARASRALDDARDRGEEAVRDGRERLVEVRARVDSARDRDENVEDPGAADVHAHARDRRVAGSHVHQGLSEVLQEKTDREHVLVADADEGLGAALELRLQALLHRRVAPAHGHSQVSGEDAVVHEHALHVAAHEDVCDRVFDVARAAAPAEEGRRQGHPGVEVCVLAVHTSEVSEQVLVFPDGSSYGLIPGL